MTFGTESFEEKPGGCLAGGRKGRSVFLISNKSLEGNNFVKFQIIFYYRYFF